MTFSTCLLRCLLALVASCTFAAGNPAKSQTALNSQVHNYATTFSESAASDRQRVISGLRPFGGNTKNHQPLDPEYQSLADLNGNVCYTMRTYKVKRTERLKDEETARRGYASCEMGAQYHFRSAGVKVRGSAPDN
jgi:hypothetical protein